LQARCEHIIILRMMFQVFVKTKKAIPGLAKIMLIVILLCSVLFAWFVQKSKLSASELKLDKQARAVTSAGKITFSIPSSWQKIDDKYLSDNMLIGWKIGSASKQALRLYVGVLGRSNITGKLRVISALKQFFPSQNAFVEPDYAQSENLPACVGAGAVIINQQMFSLYLRVLFLPDGSSFVMMFLGNRAMAGSFVLWDKQIAQTIKYFPDERIKKVSAGQKISIGALTFRLPNDSWIVKDKYFDLLTIQPIMADSSKLWIANLKTMYLPEYRKSDELLIDHFISLQTLDKTISVSKLPTKNQFITHFAQDSDSITIERQRYEYSELCWLSRAKSGESALISVNCEQDVTDAARKQIQKLLNSLSLNTNSHASKLKRINAVDIISKYNLARQSGKIPGWYLVSLGNKPIGFEALICSTLISNKQIKLAGLDYTYFDGGVIKYTQREQWKLSAKDFTGTYSARIDLRNRISAGKSAHLIIVDSAFSANSTPSFPLTRYIQSFELTIESTIMNLFVRKNSSLKAGL